MGHKLLQIVQGMLQGGCIHGSLNALHHYIFSELTNPEEKKRELSLRLSPVMHGSNEVLSLAKHNFSMTLVQPDDLDTRQWRASEMSIKVRPRAINENVCA